MADELIGLADGVNQTFAVSYEYTPGKIEIMYNGQLLTSPYDFDEYGADEPTASGLEPNEIRFIYLKPTDLTVLRANYQVGNCADGSYDGPGGVIPGEPGATNFIELTDTPTTYSGFENYYLKVNSAGTGIEFALPSGDTDEGIEAIPTGVTSVDITFTEAFDNDNYILTVSLENKIDAEPSVYPALIKNKTTTGFTVEFSGDIDTGNYFLNWRATLPGSGGMGSFGISAVSEDSSPELGGHLDVGDHLIMLDPSPNGLSSHGNQVGYSGEASEMYVSDNAGVPFACPLYMKTDGTWAACTAVSGTTQMPCMALSLEEDEGAAKKVFWRGNIKNSAWNFTPGQPIYVSTVEGAITKVKPNGGSWVQVIGRAIAIDTFRFEPDLTSENPNS